jgi:phosphomannomutase
MTIFLFDVDGTLVESSQCISAEMRNSILKLAPYGDLGLVGGGTYDKIKYQLGDVFEFFKYVFTECGSCYYTDNTLIHKNNIRLHKCYPEINKLKKVALQFLSQVDYDLTGTFIDQRDGLVYISLIGLQATLQDRNKFIEIDKVHNYRFKLLKLLNEQNTDSNLEINLGGSTGIAMLPKEWNKTQVLKYVQDEYKNIYYFGDKYLEGGNDRALINHERVIGIPVDNPQMTIDYISHKILKTV